MTVFGEVAQKDPTHAAHTLQARNVYMLSLIEAVLYVLYTIRSISGLVCIENVFISLYGFNGTALLLKYRTIKLFFKRIIQESADVLYVLTWWRIDWMLLVKVVLYVSVSPQGLLLSTMNKMKNFKRRFSLSVPRTETIEENEFTEQINQLNIQHTQGKNPYIYNFYKIHPSIDPSIHPSIHPSIGPSIRPSIHPVLRYGTQVCSRFQALLWEFSMAAPILWNYLLEFSSITITGKQLYPL